MKIETRKIADLKELEGNTKIHTAAQIQHIQQSIKEFGFTQPLVIADDNTILVGHGRMFAARELGLEEVPCVVARNLSRSQQLALSLADNTIHAETGMETKSLGEILGSLNEIGFDISQFGLDLPDVGDMGGFVPNPEDEQTEAAGIRQVSLYFENEEFAAVVARLNRLVNSETGWSNHTEVAEGLLKEFLDAHN